MGDLIVIASYATFLMLPGLFEAPNLPLLARASYRRRMALRRRTSVRPIGRRRPRLFSEVQLYSGPLPVTLLAIAELCWALQLGAHIPPASFRCSDAFVVTMSPLNAVVSLTNLLPILAAFCSSCPGYTTYHAAVLYPNQSAWRSRRRLRCCLDRETTASAIALGDLVADCLVLCNARTQRKRASAMPTGWGTAPPHGRCVPGHDEQKPVRSQEVVSDTTAIERRAS